MSEFQPLLDRYFYGRKQSAWEVWQARAELAMPAEGGSEAPAEGRYCGSGGMTPLTAPSETTPAKMEIHDNHVEGNLYPQGRPSDVTMVDPTQFQKAVDPAQTFGEIGVPLLGPDLKLSDAFEIGYKEGFLAGQRSKEGK